MRAERRAFLGLMAGAASLVASSSPGMAASKPGGGHPPDVGRKFDASGQVRRFDGNTVICHLDQQGPNAVLFNALLDIYRASPKHPFLRKVTLLPPSSYHMTIFGGATDQDRSPGPWPTDLPPDLPIADCNRILGERLKAFRLDCEMPLRLRVDLSEPDPNERPLTLRLVPFDAAENAKLRRLRDRLADVMGIHTPGHQTYRFHVTLGYLITWLDEQERADFREQLSAWHRELALTCPMIALGAPEYCTVKDMFAFQRQFYLS